MEIVKNVSRLLDHLEIATHDVAQNNQSNHRNVELQVLDQLVCYEFQWIALKSTADLLEARTRKLALVVTVLTPHAFTSYVVFVKALTAILTDQRGSFDDFLSQTNWQLHYSVLSSVHLVNFQMAGDVSKPFFGLYLAKPSLILLTLILFLKPIVEF